MGFFRQKKKKSSRAKGKARSSESGVTPAPAPPERPQVPAEPATELRVSAPRKSASPKARVNAPMEVKLLAIETWEAGPKGILELRYLLQQDQAGGLYDGAIGGLGVP